MGDPIETREMSDDDPEAAREGVVQAMERAAERYGLNRSCGRIYGILFFADEPRSLDGLAEESGYAKSTVSTATQTLERLSLIRRRSQPQAGRRAYFEAERDVRSVLAEALGSHADREIGELRRTLEAAQKRLEAYEDENETDLERVRNLRTVVDEVGTIATLLSQIPPDQITEALEGSVAAEETPSPGFYPRWNWRR